MSTKGFDTAAVLNQEKAEALKSLGYDFAIRYLVPASYKKALSRAEAEALNAAGLLVGCCWETTAARASLGAAAGAADGKSALLCATDICVPTTAVIYFAVDYAAPISDYDRIEAYLRAAAAACRPYRLGVYGSYYVVEEMHRRGVGEAYWQCVGWSDGMVSPRLNIYQKEWNVSTPVVTVDNCYLDGSTSAAGLWRYEEKPMIYTFKPKEMGIYHNSGKKSITQIQKELNCDVICNLNLFNGNWTGACYTRSNGKVIGSDGYGYYGYGFDRNDSTFVRDWSYKDKHDNFFGCWDVILGSEPTQSAVPSWTSGLRRRTVIGKTRDGSILIYANTTPESPEKMVQNLLAAGVIDAICLDGGGSTQLRCPTGVVVSSDKTPRAVHTLFWANLSVKKPVCPYAEPTSNVRLLSFGSNARWVQWMLNQYGYGLSVDGIIGVKSVAAIKDFQKKHNLTADGIVGELTREALINGR